MEWWNSFVLSLLSLNTLIDCLTINNAVSHHWLSGQNWNKLLHFNQFLHFTITSSFAHWGTSPGRHYCLSYPTLYLQPKESNIQMCCIQGLMLSDVRHIIQKVFTPLDFFHILLCYSLNFKWFKSWFLSPAYTQYPIMSKSKYAFQLFYNIESWNVLSQ